MTLPTKGEMSVYLYVPNLIGYVRVALALFGYSVALTHYHLTLGAYWLSQMLDAADGYAARVLGQSSTFGAVLDMVTDRTSTTCLCIVLARLYPDYIIGFCSLVMLDMFSHWCVRASGGPSLARSAHASPLPRAGTTCTRACCSAKTPTRR